MKVDIELIQRGGVAPLIFSNVHRSDHRWSSEELSSAKEPQNGVLFGCHIDSSPGFRFRFENREKPARGQFRRSTFISVFVPKIMFRVRSFSPSKLKVLPRDSAGQFVCITKLVGSVHSTVRSHPLAGVTQYLPSYTIPSFKE